MLDAHEFADAVGMLYEAATVPEVWPEAIARLSGIAGCYGGLLFTHSQHGTNWVSCDTLRPVVQKFIDDGWMQRNARMEGLLAHCGTGFVSDHDVFSAEDLEQMPVYREFLIPNGFGWATATHVRSASGDNIILSLERKYDSGPVSRREIEVLDGIRPHLARAAVLASKLQMQRAQASLDSFEAAGAPAALVGKGGIVTASNASFEMLSKQVIARSFGRIALLDQRANPLLQQSLRDLGHDRIGDRRSIAVPRHEDMPAFIIHILPVRRQARDVFSRAEAMLVVTTSGKSLRVEASILCELYDLTRAEASIANGLLEGLTVDELALSRGVSRETVRTQVKNVLEKTGCRSQVDFVRRLAPLASAPG